MVNLMKRLGLLFLVIVGAIVVGGLWRAKPLTSADQNGVLVLPDREGDFAKANGPLDFAFPRDHGAHPDFQTEWWYYTGNLTSEDGRKFGYQLTFFRRALPGSEEGSKRTSAWAASQVYLAHLTLTDVDGGNFVFRERFSRGAAGLTGATGVPQYQVWLDDWSVTQLDENSYTLRAGFDEGGLSLTLIDLKGPILQGDRGYSRKGQDPGNASYYYSLTRLESNGSLTFQEAEYSVNGHSWMDHEWSTSALALDQVGWDWFSIQLDDGSEFMLYTIRKTDGSIDPFSNGMLVREDGTSLAIGRENFSIKIEDTWHSPHTGADYPARWTVSVPEEQLNLEIHPLVPDQELRLSFIYWEGAVNIRGQKAGLPINGRGYVELTGYAQSLQGQF